VQLRKGCREVDLDNNHFPSRAVRITCAVILGLLGAMTQFGGVRAAVGVHEEPSSTEFIIACSFLVIGAGCWTFGYRLAVGIPPLRLALLIVVLIPLAQVLFLFFLAVTTGIWTRSMIAFSLFFCALLIADSFLYKFLMKNVSFAK
jgi:hypothetical protein